MWKNLVSVKTKNWMQYILLLVLKSSTKKTKLFKIELDSRISFNYLFEKKTSMNFTNQNGFENT